MNLVALLFLAAFGPAALAAKEKGIVKSRFTLGWGRRASALDLEKRASPARNRQAWKQFRLKHGRKFVNSSEEELRSRIFEESEQFVKEHNERYEAGEETYFLAVNEYADWTQEEYRKITPLISQETVDELHSGGEVFNASTHPLTRSKRSPQSIDWRTWGAVNPVKDQGGCGSCYTFAAVAALESAFFRKYKRMLDLSEQQLVDCTSSYGNGGCSGGWMHNCYKYIQENGGISLQQTYRYEAKVGDCRHNRADAVCRISRYVIIPRNDENALKEAVGNIGPVAVAYDASTREHMMYRGGIYHSPNCDPNRTTHAVAVIGYGSENGVDFWILKNSWGATWGENGFFRMRRNTGNQCGIVTMSSYPIVE